MRGFFQNPEYLFISNSVNAPSCTECKRETLDFLANVDFEILKDSHFFTIGKFMYFTEKDIDRYYASRFCEKKESDKQKLRELRNFCKEEKITIMLPTVSNLVEKLCETIDIFIKTFEENPSLFSALGEFAISYDGDGSMV